MKKNEINIYWTPTTNTLFPTDSHIKDSSFLYPKPESLLKFMAKDKIRGEKKMSIFNCPAVTNKAKQTIVFTSPMSMEFYYQNNGTNIDVEYKSKTFIDVSLARDPEMKYGAFLLLHMGWLFFAEEPVEAFFTPPYFHEPKYTKYGSVIPGQFDIGQWFRPYQAEVLMWKNEGSFILEEGEPLFYIEFKTDKKINLKRFNHTPEVQKYSQACIDSTPMFGFGQTMLARYNRFRNIGMREKVLTAIKNNLIDDNQ